ncbi:MAG: replicative DNA helicase [Coriobacteriales bacterium]|jgi:replicative DNA helicase|nr:replicative DNA helicase [Coriobacteriales bacterium]
MSDEITNVLPQNIEAERAVLAAMILDIDERVVDEVLARLVPEAFYRPAHQKLFSAMVELSQGRTPIDQISLAARLEARGELQAVGGKAYIIEVANNDYALYNWEHHVEIVKREALLRDLIRAARDIQALGYSNTDDAGEAVEEAEKLLFNITNKRIDSTFRPIEDLLGESMTMLQTMAENESHLLGVPTGFADLDRLLAGLRGGDLVILAARPSVGKTSLALNIALNAAKEGTTVAFFSLEMPAVQLTQRVLSSEASVNASNMRSGNLSPADWKDIIDVCNDLSGYKFYIDDTADLTLIELRAKARRQLNGVKSGIIVIDYLQLMQDKGRGQQDRWVTVGEISRGLKVLAKELKVPILALSQLSRAVESRRDKRPMLSDLRESGNIEQDADVVLFVDRSTSDDEANSPDRPDPGMAKLIVGKNRNGATKDIDLYFDASYTRFRSFYRER